MRAAPHRGGSMAVSSMRLDSCQAQPIDDVTEIAILTAYQHNTICVSKQPRSPSLQHCSVRITKVSVIRRAIATTESVIGFPTDVATEVLELGQSRIDPATDRCISLRSRRSARQSPLALQQRCPAPRFPGAAHVRFGS